jgi:hypothetical protein
MAPKASSKALNQQQTAAAIASPTKQRAPPKLRVASPAKPSPVKRLRKKDDADAATEVQAPTFELAENDPSVAKEESDQTLIIIPCTRDTTPFPTAQGSSSVTDDPKDDVIQRSKRRRLLDGEDDDDNDKEDDDKVDEDDKDKDEDDTDTAAKEATKITTPSKGETVTARTSSRGRPIGSGTKKGSSPPLIISVHESFINFLSV